MCWLVLSWQVSSDGSSSQCAPVGPSITGRQHQAASGGPITGGLAEALQVGEHCLVTLGGQAGQRLGEGIDLVVQPLEPGQPADLFGRGRHARAGQVQLRPSGPTGTVDRRWPAGPRRAAHRPGTRCAAGCCMRTSDPLRQPAALPDLPDLARPGGAVKANRARIQRRRPVEHPEQRRGPGGHPTAGKCQGPSAVRWPCRSLAGCVGVNCRCCMRASPAWVASSPRAWGCWW